MEKNETLPLYTAPTYSFSHVDEAYDFAVFTLNAQEAGEYRTEGGQKVIVCDPS